MLWCFAFARLHPSQTDEHAPPRSTLVFSLPRCSRVACPALGLCWTRRAIFYGQARPRTPWRCPGLRPRQPALALGSLPRLASSLAAQQRQSGFPSNPRQVTSNQGGRPSTWNFELPSKEQTRPVPPARRPESDHQAVVRPDKSSEQRLSLS